MPFDPLNDLIPVSQLSASDGLILVVLPSSPAHTLADLIALARKPGSKVAYGSAGIGNTIHLASAMLNARAGTDMVHVPYKGGGPVLSALMAGFVAGGVVALRWRPRHLLRWGVLMLSLTAAFPLALAVADDLSVVLVGAFVHGVGLQLFSVSWDLAIQENVAENMLARVYSFDTVGSFVCRPLGLALTGPVAAVVGTDRWLVVVAAVIGLSSIAALGAPSIRGLTRRTTPAVVPESARI